MPLPHPLFDQSHEEEAPAPAPRLYVGIVFAAIFEAIAGVSVFVGYATYQFIKAWIGAR